MKWIVIFLGFNILFSCAEEDAHTSKDSKSKFLNNAKMVSSYGFYANYYHFINDSIGILEAGQAAFSTGIDPSNFPDENMYVYNDPDTFQYQIRKDTILFIQFIAKEHAESDRKRKYLYSKSDHAWISDHEFVYGKEYLKQGNKLKRIQEPPRL